MTGKEFSDYIRLMTRTNSATFVNADLLLMANARLDTLARAVMGTDEDTLIMPMATNLIAGLREYPFPQSVLARIKYVEAKFDPNGQFIHLDEFDLNQYRRPTSEEETISQFGNELHNAFYDINRKALNLYSGVIVDVVLGLKLWCNVFPAKLTVDKLADTTTDLSVDPTTTSHGFPREFHELWARGVIIDYKESREKPIPLTERENSYKYDLQEAIWDFKHGNSDRSVIAQIPPASDRGNNGQNY